MTGEYRVGLDASRRPFFYREGDTGDRPVELLANEPVTLGEAHEVHATFDGFTMRLFVDQVCGNWVDTAAANFRPDAASPRV